MTTKQKTGMATKTTAKELAQKAADLRKIIDAYLPPPDPSLPINPDHAFIGTEVMWGGIWQVPGLDVKLRSLATISAQCVNGWDFGLRHQCRVGLTLGMSPRKIKSIFFELHFYVGVPATVFGLRKAQEVIDERKEWKAQDVPSEAPWLSTLEEKMQRGRKLCRQYWGEEAARQLDDSITHEMVPEAAAIVDGYHFGEVWARSALDPKERMVCVLAALMSRGHMTQLKRHIGYALNAGLNKREICEVFAQAGWYRGWPHVEDALMQAKEVFAQRGV